VAIGLFMVTAVKSMVCLAGYTVGICLMSKVSQKIGASDSRILLQKVLVSWKPFRIFCLQPSNDSWLALQ